MKLILPAVVCLTFITASIHAASDADITLIKAKKVVIEKDTITIVAEARTRITLIRDDHDPAFTGDTWQGMPVTRVQVICNNGTFIIKRRPESVLQEALQGCEIRHEADSSIKVFPAAARAPMSSLKQ